MIDLKDKMIEIGEVVQNRGLGIIQKVDGTFNVLDKNGGVLFFDVEDIGDLHSTMIGYDEGYKAAVDFYQVVKY